MTGRKVKISLLLVSVGILISSSNSLLISQKPVHLTGIQLSDFEKGLFNTGDILFRKAEGLGSNYVVSIDPNSEYSHVGIVHINEDLIFVIHASPITSNNNSGVREEPLDEYLRDIPAAALFRVNSSNYNQIQDAVNNARSYVGRIPFDFKFSLNSNQTLYCTELVWIAYRDAGIDLLNSFDHLNLPILGEGKYILPSSLANSTSIHLISKFKINQ